jgi:predicted lipoprotein with Yx(FWY)xxD motif
MTGKIQRVGGGALTTHLEPVLDEGAQMRCFTPLFVLLALAAALSTSALAARQTAGPVVKFNTAKFGPVLATQGHLALYAWNQEKGAKVKCTGACAKTWPPLTLPHGTMAPKHIAGVMGTFGDVVRPDGRTQVTYDGHPLYTFHGDTAKKILCNGVDGWFVVRVH